MKLTTGRTFGWHFTGSKLRDGSPLPKIGRWEVYKGKLSLCNTGLHVGITPWDALQNAPGDTLRFCEYAEVGETHTDKLVCARRRTIAQMDAKEMLNYFARLQAISCLEKWTQEPPEIVLDYLATGDENIRDVAWVAADAAWAAAWAAGVAGDAAKAAAWAAGDVAWVAADTAWAAAWATGDAAWDAAEAAWVAARDDYNSLVYESFEGPMRQVGFKPCEPR